MHRIDMPLGKKRTYLDWASGAPVSLRARKAFSRALADHGNPSSPHEEGRRAKTRLSEARATVAKLLEVKPSGVVFTSGATEANNLALTGHVMALKGMPLGDKGIHVLYLPGAHASVHETVRALTRWGVVIEPLKIADGQVDLSALAGQLRPETRLVCLDAVCGETGTKYDTRGVRTQLDAYARRSAAPRALLHVDASQAPLALPFDLTRLSADMITLDAQKAGGVRGAGVLAMRSSVPIAPLMHGGEQEGGLRAGTEAVALLASFAEALVEASEGRERFALSAARGRELLLRALKKELPDIKENRGREGAPHILNVSLPGRDMDYAVVLLDRDGFAVATKSACESDAAHGSRAVMMLTNDEERARSALRVSWGPSTPPGDLTRFAHALVRTIRFLDDASV